MKALTRLPVLALAAHVTLSACSTKDEAPPIGCEPGVTNGCSGGQVCEPYAERSGYRCADPLELRGSVTSLAGAAVSGARVTPLDASGVPVGDAATTGAPGTWAVRVSVPRAADGDPAGGDLSLRVDAPGYQSFPTELRAPVAIASTAATHEGGLWVLDVPQGDVALIARPVAAAGRIHGTVELPAGKAALIVAERAGAAGLTAVADRSGAYRIFDVPDGSYEVIAYTAAASHQKWSIAVTSGADVEASPALNSTALASVAGTLQLTNVDPGASASVELAIASTVDAGELHGEVPVGLRATGVTGSFTIAGVPNGEYAVLASYENDGTVRKSVLQRVTVSEGAVSPALETIAITRALPVVSPGASGVEDVTQVDPVFSWTDDSGEDGYRLSLYDAFGALAWDGGTVPPGSGGTVSATYAGPGLTTGAWYQFRACSFAGGVDLRCTEEQRGVFRYVPGT